MLVHGFIDGEDGIIYQTLPWDHRGWHCGSGSKESGNNTHIGVEMCEPVYIKYTAGSNFTCSNIIKAKEVVKRTYETAVELFAMLCKKYELDPLADGVIISHKEGNSRGIASNHGDPEHLWDGLGLGYTINGFRKAVAAAMNNNARNQVNGVEVQPVAKWIQEPNGCWWYRHADGSFAMNGWEQIDGNWYYFDEKGWMQTGWVYEKGKWYYLKESGEMAAGEVLMIHHLEFGDEWYAFASDGHMLTQVSRRGALI